MKLIKKLVRSVTHKVSGHKKALQQYHEAVANIRLSYSRAKQEALEQNADEYQVLLTNTFGNLDFTTRLQQLDVQLANISLLQSAFAELTGTNGDDSTYSNIKHLLDNSEQYPELYSVLMDTNPLLLAICSVKVRANTTPVIKLVLQHVLDNNISLDYSSLIPNSNTSIAIACLLDSELDVAELMQTLIARDVEQAIVTNNVAYISKIMPSLLLYPCIDLQLALNAATSAGSVEVAKYIAKSSGLQPSKKIVANIYADFIRSGQELVANINAHLDSMQLSHAGLDLRQTVMQNMQRELVSLQQELTPLRDDDISAQHFKLAGKSADSANLPSSILQNLAMLAGHKNLIPKELLIAERLGIGALKFTYKTVDDTVSMGRGFFLHNVQTEVLISFEMLEKEYAAIDSFVVGRLRITPPQVAISGISSLKSGGPVIGDASFNLTNFLRDFYKHEYGKQVTLDLNEIGTELQSIRNCLATEWADKVKELQWQETRSLIAANSNEYAELAKCINVINNLPGFNGGADSGTLTAALKLPTGDINYVWDQIVNGTYSRYKTFLLESDANASSLLLSAIKLNSAFRFPSTSLVHYQDVCQVMQGISWGIAKINSNVQEYLLALQSEEKSKEQLKQELDAKYNSLIAQISKYYDDKLQEEISGLYQSYRSGRKVARRKLKIAFAKTIASSFCSALLIKMYVANVASSLTFLPRQAAAEAIVGSGIKTAVNLATFGDAKQIFKKFGNGLVKKYAGEILVNYLLFENAALANTPGLVRGSTIKVAKMMLPRALAFKFNKKILIDDSVGLLTNQVGNIFDLQDIHIKFANASIKLWINPDNATEILLSIVGTVAEVLGDKCAISMLANELEVNSEFITPNKQNDCNNKRENGGQFDGGNENSDLTSYDKQKTTQKNLEPKPIITQFDKLSSATNQDGWRPMKGSTGAKKRTTRVKKDKSGSVKHHDPETGKYSKNVLKQAKDDFKNGVMDSGIDFDGVNVDLTKSKTVNDQVTPGACAEGVFCWDFGRTNVLDDPNNQSGGRAYVAADETEANISLKKGNIDVKGGVGGTIGVNLASMQRPDGKARVDVDLVKVEVGASGEISVDDKGKVKANSFFSAAGKFVDVNAEATLPEFCFQDSCYETTIGAEAAIGAGAEGGIGYEEYKSKPGGSFTASLGFGLGGFLKGNVKVDTKPNDNNKRPKL